MRALARAWRAWVELMDRREPATQLALVRIAIGVVLVADLLNVRRLGLVEPLWTPPPVGYAVHYTPWLGLGASALWAIALVAAACLAAGAATRAACVVFVLASIQMSQLAPEAECGVDMIFRVVLLVLALSRCNARWSLDAMIARRFRRPPPALVPAWPRYLILLQVVWVYASGGQNKSGGEWGPWGGFAALADSLADPHAARFTAGWVPAVLPLTRIATALTMAFEVGAPLYLLFLYYAATRDRPGRLRAWCNRWRLRWIWLGLGVSFELGLAVMLRLDLFPYGMLAMFPALVLASDVERVYRRNTPGPANRASSPS